MRDIKFHKVTNHLEFEGFDDTTIDEVATELDTRFGVDAYWFDRRDIIGALWSVGFSFGEAEDLTSTL